MSATYPIRKTAPIRKAAAKPRPRLVVITSQRRVVARGPFIALVGALMLGGLLALLMLHTLAAQDAFQQTTLQQKLTTLTDTEQQLEQQVQTDSAPAALEARAKALGMVPSIISSYHRDPAGGTVAREVPVSQIASSTNTSSTTTATTSTAPTSTSTDATTATTTPTSSTADPSTKTSKKHVGTTSR
jgi:cell division protein FtsB